MLPKFLTNQYSFLYLLSNWGSTEIRQTCYWFLSWRRKGDALTPHQPLLGCGSAPFGPWGGLPGTHRYSHSSAGFLTCHFPLLVDVFAVGLFMVIAIETFFSMGQSSSNTQVPLDMVFSHFQDFQNAAAISSAQVELGQLWILCALEWSAFQVGWPPGGSFNLSLIFKVQSVVFSHPRHSD